VHPYSGSAFELISMVNDAEIRELLRLTADA
jgi:hypothetical protein